MTYSRFVLLNLLTTLSFIGAIGTTLIKPKVYEIRNVNSSCTLQEMKIQLELNKNFQGVVYAKGFPLEKNCRATGTGSTFVDITIDTTECGVRLVSKNDETLNLRVTLNVQMDKFLQQITDLEVSTICSLPVNEVTYFKKGTNNRQVSRKGRNKASDGSIPKENNELSEIKTWMEIEGTSDFGNDNKVSVGEQTMMLVKSFLPDDIDSNVVDCYAYDGTRDVVQKLLDENGCPLDETIMPSLEIVKYDNKDSSENEIDSTSKQEILKKGEGFDLLKKKNFKMSSQNGELYKKELMDFDDSDTINSRGNIRLQVMGTIFSAFKFPDTSNLHLRCILQICRQTCPLVSCDSGTHDRIGKSVKSKRNSSSIIEKIEVFNSVEVLAPGIDADGILLNRDEFDSKVNLKENSFCLSASKMAFSFAILGAIFLCGVLAALWTVMRNHIRKAHKIDGSEQILVVRDSPLNFRHTRNKAFTNWTYS